jgi:hypothetical protein
MPCGCGAQYQQHWQAEVKLWSEVTEGIPHGAGITLKPSTMIVCRNCGEATLRLWQDDLNVLKQRTS